MCDATNKKVAGDCMQPCFGFIAQVGAARDWKYFWTPE